MNHAKSMVTVPALLLYICTTIIETFAAKIIKLLNRLGGPPETMKPEWKIEVLWDFKSCYKCMISFSNFCRIQDNQVTPLYRYCILMLPKNKNRWTSDIP